MLRSLTRRQFTKLLAGAATALPLLEALPARAQQAAAAPKRMVLLFNPNGTITEAFWPAAGATETEFTLGPILAPLADFKDRMLLLHGIEISVAEQPNVGPGGPHQKGLGGLFTGRELQTGTMADGDGSLAGWANGISVDQQVVQSLNPPTLLPSLELGVRATASDVMGRISYSGPGAPVPPMNDPGEVFQRLNSGFVKDLDGPDQAAARDQRRMVMAAVQAQYSALKNRVSVKDREKLELHADFLNGIVRRLDYGVRPGPFCNQPAPPRKVAVDDANDMPDIATLQMDLLAVALACDLTRVASVQFSTAINAIPFPWLGSSAEGHNLSHRGPSDTAARDQLVARATWYAEKVAYLVKQLAAITEGDRTLLDNTVLVWGNELSVGNTHSHKDVPFLTIGSAGGYFKTGRYLDFGSVPNNRLLISLLNAMGVEATTFGHPEFGKAGPLPGLTA